MTPAYMPFSYLSESTARILASLVGPVVIYQPLKKAIPQSLIALASQGLIRICTPMTRDDDRLRAALSEFTEWARVNPGKVTPGAQFFSQRQGEVPFFDDTTINRIRSEIKRYPLSDHQLESTETGFSARLFLALSQENDMATDHLDHDLRRFKSQEKEFLASMKDADEAEFERQTLGGTIWRDDQGTKHTGQRIRAWATLAAADSERPDLLITTSPAVIETLLETHGDALRLDRLADIRFAVPPAEPSPALGRVLADFVSRDTLPSADLSAFERLDAGAASGPLATITLFVAAGQTPARVLRRMAPATTAPAEEKQPPETVGHTLIVLVES